MKPILFDGSATNFNTNGLGVLSDCKSCLVTEERNGIYEVEFEYPITGVRYKSITTGRIILVSHDERKDLQPFIIYRISRPISGIVTVNAHHISYKLNNVIVAPYTASSVSGALSGLRSHAITSNPFTFWTDKSSSGSFAVDTPAPVRAILGGVQGSILDAFGGGEYEFDNYTVKLYAHRGNNNGVTIRYGKNLTSITADTDADGLYNSVVPYWTDTSGTVVYGSVVSGSGGVIQEETWTDERGVAMQDEQGVTLTFNAILQRVSVMDLSNYFDEAPTAAQLQSRAQAILNSNTPWIPKENIRIDFVALWQTEEHKDIAMLERVRLCDTVTVQYAELGVDATAKVIRVVWDALAERYSEIELGTAKTSFADTILAETDEKLKEYPSKSFLEEAVDHATQQITGGLGGNVVIGRDGNGDPVELLIMDTKDKATAVNVWRWNLGGLGHSSDGYDGPFGDFAITQDGHLNADFITVGHMLCNILQGGTLTLGGVDNGNGVLIVLDASGSEVGRFDNTGLSATGDLTIKKSGKTAKFTDISYSYRVGTILYNRTSTGLQVEYQNNSKLKSAKQIAPADSGIFVENGVSTNVGCFSGYQCYVDDTKASGYEYQWAYYDNGLVSLYSVPISGNTEGILYLGGTLIRFGGEDRNIHIYDDVFIVSIPGNSQFIYADPVDNGRLAVNNKWVQFESSSSIRYKHNVKLIEDDELDPHRLLGLPVKQFEWNDDHPLQYPDMANKTIPGFIAEDVAEIYPSAVIHDVEGNIESWDERRVIPGMLKLIQEQHEKIESLMDRITKLESIVASLYKE